MEYKTIIMEKKEGVATLTFNRPDKLNAYNLQVSDELKHAVADVKDDPDLRVLVLTGAERAFMAGADISMVQDWSEKAKKGEAIRSLVASHFSPTRLEELEIPTIAAVHGFAFGMGCEIALGCDFRIATESAQFGLPEIKLGLIPGGGGSQRLTRLIGATKALEMAMIGDSIDAQEAYRLGIVNKVVPDNQLMEEVDKLAKKIIRLGKIAVSSVKAAIYKCLSTGIYDGIECELDKFSLILATEDATEGTTAFLEKRRPEFKGK